MTIESEVHRRILLERANTILNSENYLTLAQRAEWENYLHAVQDVDASGEFTSFPQMPSEPVYPLNPTQQSNRTQAIANQTQIRAEFVNMIARLQQIQNANNPTNTQVIQAIRDEALYIERIMRVIKRLFE